MFTLQEDNPGSQGTGGTVIRVSLKDIGTDEETFQWRLSGWEKTAEGRDQIKDLVRHLRVTQEPLTPLLVYPQDGRYIVVDGHHRLAAYKEFFWGKAVPVVVFQGTLQEARDAAFVANGKGHRTYSSQERLEKAWDDTKRWFFDGVKELTVERTARTSGVGTRTVGHMRARLKERGGEIRELSWSEVLRGRAEYNPDPDWHDKKVQELKEALLGLNVIRYTQSPDILAKAIESISPNLARSLVEQWTPIALEIAQYYELEQEEREAAEDAGLIPRI